MGLGQLTLHYQNRMRFDRKSKQSRKQWSLNAHAAKARKRMEEPPPERIERPAPGLLLHTIRVTNELAGMSFEIKVKQGARLNSIRAETFGRSSRDHGTDWLTRHLRKKLVTKWLHE